MISEFGDLYYKLIDLFFRYDPVDINFETNKDEYEPEVRTILPRLKECNSPDEVASMIHQEFARWFIGEEEYKNRHESDSLPVVGSKENYIQIANEIWELWNQSHWKQ